MKQYYPLSSNFTMPSGGVFSIKWMFFQALREKNVSNSWYVYNHLPKIADSVFCIVAGKVVRKLCVCVILYLTSDYEWKIFIIPDTCWIDKKNPVLRGVLTRLRLRLGHYGVKSGNPSQGCLPETICELIHKIRNPEQGPQTLDPWKTKHKKEKNVVYRVSFLPHWNELIFVESLSVLWPTMPFAIC